MGAETVTRPTARSSWAAFARFSPSHALGVAVVDDGYAALVPPSAVRRPATVLAVEGVILVVVGLGYGVTGILASPTDRFATIVAGLMLGLLGVGLLLLARAVAAFRTWARSPAVTLQLLALPVGIGLVQNGVFAPAAVVLSLAVCVLVLFAQPEARAVFDHR